MCMCPGRSREVRVVQGSRATPDSDEPTQLPMGQLFLTTAIADGDPNSGGHGATTRPQQGD